MELRDYQNKLVDDTRQSIKEGHKRILMQAYVGAGKTIIAGEIARLAKEKLKRSLFIAPRRQLVYQAEEKFQALGLSTGIIMAGERPFRMPLIQIGSIDTLTTRINNGRMLLPDASILIVDEAHAVFSKKRLDFLSQFHYVIGVTSTPALANGRGMGSFYTDLVQGPTMKELVDNGFLVPMRYFAAAAPDLEKIKLDDDGDYQQKALAEASDKPELIGGIYENYKRLAGDRSTLIFAVSCKHGRHIEQEFRRHGVAVEYIDAHTPTDERIAMERRVALGVTKVVVNILVMSFGSDWPIFSCVIIARATKNICAWIQMCGRGSRLHPTKSDCYIIYHGSNFDELGPLDSPIEWSLDDKTTVKERKQKDRIDKKEPKDITCSNPECGHIFRSSRNCPKCGCQMVPPGEMIPYHEAELVEINTPKKPSPEEKASWYSQALYVAQQKGYMRGWADHLFNKKWGHFPAKKNGIQPMEPTQEVLNYIKYDQIRRAKSKYQHGANPCHS